MGSMSTESENLTATANFAGRWVDKNERITLRLSRPPQPSDGKLAVFLGSTDMTHVFELQGNYLNYVPTIVSLPSGETELLLYTVSESEEWQEVARFRLQVLTVTGFEKNLFDPGINLNGNGQVVEEPSPEGDSGNRLVVVHRDVTGQIALTTELLRGNASLQSQWNAVGVSSREQALRFGEKGSAAPRFDLSNYLIQIKSGSLQFSLGHIFHGSNRLLLNGFGSRGAMIKTTYGSRIEASYAVLNGTSIVGWNNFLGLNSDRHRVFSGTLGLDLLAQGHGTLRLETTYLDGSILPRDNFNQGSITDAEQNRGYALRILAGDNSQRLRLEGGFARSRFTNPQDPFLSESTDLVPVRETTKNARYIEICIGILRNLKMSETWQVNLTMNVRHQRVDPLYRSIGAFVPADLQENAIEVQATAGIFSTQYTYGRMTDNLDDIPSILRTHTRRHSVSMSSVPAALFQAQPKWVPVISYAFDTTHQFGDHAPENGGFLEIHIPDQISRFQNVSLDWQGNRWRSGYRMGLSSQDNRQAGRENADFESFNNTLSFGLNPISRMDFGVDLSLEQSESKEAKRKDVTKNVGFNLALQTTNNSTLMGNFNTTSAQDRPKTSERTNTQTTVQWSMRFDLARAAKAPFLQVQFFIRYTRQKSDFRDQGFSFTGSQENWVINTGANISLF
jgi:hypothetical protein